MTDYVALQSVWFNDLTIRFSIQGLLDKIEVIVTDGNSTFKKKMFEINEIGRINIDNLKPDTQYRISLRAGKYCQSLTARTLPSPQGEPIFRFAVIGDPHLTVKPENRNGRLHCESHGLLREIIHEINMTGTDFLLLAGDVTESGLSPEYEKAAAILQEFSGETFITPGNHDIVGGEKSLQLWTTYFGTTTKLREYNGWQIASLDTSDEHLNKSKNLKIISELNKDMPCLIVSHYQLFPDDFITCADRHICDANICRNALEKLRDMNGIIYVGHKNIASRVDTGNIIQLNVPQVTHFPAGYLAVTAYANGLYHRFQPIYSELLNEYSRKDSVKCGISTVYRDGNSLKNWNVVMPVQVPSKILTSGV